MNIVLPLIAAIVLTECPNCDRRMRISDDGETAQVNVCRLRDDGPDEKLLEQRVAALTERAKRYLALARRRGTGDPKCPLMGWSSWNTFGTGISDSLILDCARAMATNGLKEAGYLYVNTDDGFFWGHGEDGVLKFDPNRFPNGMKGMVDGIHALGLRAGIYSDAGADTCGTMAGGGSNPKNKGGFGGGLYGHDAADCKLFFNDIGFDFIKVDYCGGCKLMLKERKRYTEIAQAIRATGRTDVRFNMCRWAFPGTWAAEIAGSWRTTTDIRANWAAVRRIVARNLYLGAYASPGHYNDMDMLEVGWHKDGPKSVFACYGDTGLTEEEETAHFGMWCMMSSPLLIGCDARRVPRPTFRLITNPYLIAMNQNCGLGVQGRVVSRSGEAYVLVKDADELFGLSRYVALYNAMDVEHEFCVKTDDLELGGRVEAFDLVDRSDVGEWGRHVFIRVSAHGARFFRVDAERRLERTVYEAESAYLPDYQELYDKKDAGTPEIYQNPHASGGVAVRYLGGRSGNDVVWKDVRIVGGGLRTLEILCSSQKDCAFTVEVDGQDRVKLEVKAGTGDFESQCATFNLSEGVHSVRLFNSSSALPEVDVMYVRKKTDGWRK